MPFHTLLLNTFIAFGGLAWSQSSTSGTWPRGRPGTGSLSLPVVRTPKTTLIQRGLEVQLHNRSDVAYHAQVEIGTPPQKVYVHLDTGSYELWVNPDCDRLDESSETFCEAVGNYDPSLSSTSETTIDKSIINYGIGSATIDYITDDISISGSYNITNVRFGVAKTSQDQFAGVLGLGYGNGYNTEYNTFIDELYDQDAIKTKTFSLALGSKDEEEGVMIFGGVDTSKFTGELVSLPITPAEYAPDGHARYWVNMSSISIATPEGEETTVASSDMPVFIDSGSTLSQLPPALVDEIAGYIGSTEQDDDDYWLVDCALVDTNGTVGFSFEGITVDVSYREIIREIHTDPPRCYLGIAPSDTFSLLGDTFLRSVYAVFDLESDKIHLAPYSNCGSSVEAITDADDLEGLSGSCAAVGSDTESTSTTSATTISRPSPTTASGTTAETSSRLASTTSMAEASTTSETAPSSSPVDEQGESNSDDAEGGASGAGKGLDNVGYVVGAVMVVLWAV